jgi:hypothetical protein
MPGQARWWTVILIIAASSGQIWAQDSHSVARQWNEELLQSIRTDFARPTVHARNLFHVSAAMYDAWAAYDETAEPYLLGNSIGAFHCPYQPPQDQPIDSKAAQEEAASFAAYRVLRHRFSRSPLPSVKFRSYDALMRALGYDVEFYSTEYQTGSPAALGNYIASCIIAFGMQDGANEQNDYENVFYEPVNPSLAPARPGNPRIVDRNRWQPLTLQIFIDQSGNEILGGGADFLSPEWGSVVPFSLQEADLTIHTRDGHDWWVYHDPGSPPHLDTLDDRGLADPYKWNFNLVSVWSAHLDPSDGVMWDISPASIGNVPELPTSFEEYPEFYDFLEGGDPSAGHPINPHTGQPYEPQIVPRGDYTRVLAEFWADGPESETPPGHWFTILNYVNDHPNFERRFRGEGEIVDPLEWDVKAYFALGGAMHDAAIAAWGVKGYYDYIRPVSALRSMADQGQCSDPALAKYSPDGIPLIPGFVEMVSANDPLVGDSLHHVDKVKLMAWRGPDYVEDPETDQAGVGWILAENWWPYQRPSFVTPPFAGYVSGHSTYSRAAAELMTLLTGDPYFPGGMGEFVARKNEFLVFEEGPSVDITLQWATYRDASDQCSLSRIWGGIHPPADDIPGRLIGERIGVEAFAYAERYFGGAATATELAELPANLDAIQVYPNPARRGQAVSILAPSAGRTSLLEVFNVNGQLVQEATRQANLLFEFDSASLTPGLYLIRVSNTETEHVGKVLIY